MRGLNKSDHVPLSFLFVTQLLVLQHRNLCNFFIGYYSVTEDEMMQSITCLKLDGILGLTCGLFC